MCGITGYVGVQELGLLERMTASLAHRGPDDSGFFRDGDAGLGHRRLSIIDLESGHQPIENEDGSLVLIVNGEVYGHGELREWLESKGHVFRTNSDSEVLVHLYEEEGPAGLERVNGMFALAIWERGPRRLFLARDRLGIKPLYYARVGDKLAFASESKALLCWSGLERTLDAGALHQYLALRYVPGPGGLLQEVKKLPAGSWARFEGGKLTLERWWDPPFHLEEAGGSEEEWLEGLAERFERSIQRRLVADVPVGAYLSSGLDSSTIVAAVARQSSQPVKTFTVGFNYEHDELADARATAAELGCDHTEIECRVSDIELLPKLVWHLDEPVGDPIVIPMYQLAREAKKAVTVVLTGEGADETMGGYLFHKALLSGNRIASFVPRAIRQGLLPRLVDLTPEALFNLAFQYPADLGQRGKQKVRDFVSMMGPERLPDAYLHLISLFDHRDTSGLYTDDFAARLGAGPEHPPEWGSLDRGPFLNRVLHLQFAHWLSDDILTKQDKMSMASGIEGRVPFLDHEYVEYALSVPARFKIRGGTTKYLLRRYAERLLPERVTAKRKMPFYNPIEDYFREPVFQELLADTLSEERIRSRGIFRPDAIEKLKESMRGGEFIHVKQVFSLIVLELWFQMALDGAGPAPSDSR